MVISLQIDAEFKSFSHLKVSLRLNSHGEPALPQSFLLLTSSSNLDIIFIILDDISRSIFGYI